MDLSKFNLKPLQIFKLGGVALLFILIIAFAIRLLSSSFSVGTKGLLELVPGYAGNLPESSASYDTPYEGKTLSMRNIFPASTNQPVAGKDAEEFEVTEYTGQIETDDKTETCKVFLDLKKKDYVIFETANEYDLGCNYTFKVALDHVDEVLTVINELDPRELSENTYTIKRQIEDFTSSLQILERKQSAIDETLKNAIAAYDDITRLATRIQDVESLARIIDSKIQIIERLTEQRLAVQEQLEQLARAKAEQLDRLEYTYFHINVTENKYLNNDEFKDSWRMVVREFLRDVNQVIQDVTVGLVGLVFMAMQYLLYFFLLLIVVKYVWKLTKAIWSK